MRKIMALLFLLSLPFLPGNSYAQKKGYDLNWQTDFESAKTIAKSKKKLILIYFTGSDWSTSCKNLNEDFFYTDKFKSLADKHLILVRVDSPHRPNLISELQKDYNQELSRIYHQRVFPTVVLVDHLGTKIGAVESYNFLHDTSKHYKLINDALKKKR
tara:strand:+ start:32881 stop:33354 length:474 start_codon:yes stop_codon:yes gene_type:complete